MLIRKPSTLASSLRPYDLGLPSHFKSFFPWQLKTAIQIVDAFKTHRFVFLNAPPGIGKSVINTTIATLLGARFCYLVPTKALARQVTSEFGSMLTEVHGHSNYSCAELLPENELFECIAGKFCEYKEQIKDIRETRSNVLTNYAHQLSLGTNGTVGDVGMGSFDLLICDEGHTLKNWLSDFTAIKIRPKFFSQLGITQFPKSRDILRWQEWALEVYATIDRSKYEGQTKKLVDRAKLILYRLANHVSQTWINIQRDDHYLFHPVWARGFNENAFHGIGKVLLTSATLFESERIPLGIKREDVAYIEIPSQFPAKQRPFIFCPWEFVDYRMTPTTWGNLVRKVDQYVEARPHKGIIQTKSFARAEDYYDHSRLKDRIILDSTGKAGPKLQEYLRSKKPVVLVSPRVEEGHDFKGDKGRFNVILKLPRYDKRDPIIAARQKEFSGYLDNGTMESLIQGYGRVVRDMSDWGETMIPDRHFEKFVQRRQLPGYVQDAYRIEKGFVNPLSEELGE